MDSVAEHQALRPDAYFFYLFYTCYVAPVGWLLLFWKPTNGRTFLIMYAAFGYFFSSRMNRLVILMGPIASALSGVAMGLAFEWAVRQRRVLAFWAATPEEPATAAAPPPPPADGKPAAAAGKKGSSPAAAAAAAPMPFSALLKAYQAASAISWHIYNSRSVKLLRLIAAVAILFVLPK